MSAKFLFCLSFQIVQSAPLLLKIVENVGCMSTAWIRIRRRVLSESNGPITRTSNQPESSGISRNGINFKIRTTFGQGLQNYKRCSNAARIHRMKFDPASNDSCTFRVYKRSNAARM